MSDKSAPLTVAEIDAILTAPKLRTKGGSWWGHKDEGL